MISSKIEKLVLEDLINERDISTLIDTRMIEGNFKIYKAIHDKFNQVDF